MVTETWRALEIRMTHTHIESSCKSMFYYLQFKGLNHDQISYKAVTDVKDWIIVLWIIGSLS